MAWLLALVLLSVDKGPSQEARVAATDLGRITVGGEGVAPEDPTNFHYLTNYYNLDPKSAAEEVSVARFWTNSLSRRRRIGQLEKVSDSLYRVDLRDYGWKKESWENLIVNKRGYRIEPYFAAELLDQASEYQLRYLSKSAGAILRMDYFIAKTSLEPHYSDFLGLPNKLDQLQKDFFVQADGVQKLGLREGGAVLESIVALHNRQLERWPTITGAFWLSRDAGSSAKKQNVLENVFEIQADAGEFIWHLPNGLQAYYLANNNGVQQTEVPFNLAQDSRTPLRDKTVRVPLNCVGCHAEGINPFSNVVAKLIRGGATYASKKKEETLAIEEYHLSPLAIQIERDNQRYADAVTLCNGMLAKENAIAYEKVVAKYVDGRIDLATAAREIGHSPEKLRKSLPLLYSGTANALLAGESIARDAWESIAYKSALLCYGKGEAKK